MKWFSILFIICATINGQVVEEFSIEGKVVVYHELEKLEKINGYVVANGKNRIDSSGNFFIPKLKMGENKLSFVLINGAILKDTIVNLKKNIKNFELQIFNDCLINRSKAVFDIHYGVPKLYLSSGIAGELISKSEKFEKKYGVEYYDFGCVSPSYSCILDYNFTIFEYLDLTTDKKWRKNVSKSVIGLKEYKKKKRKKTSFS